MSSNLFVGKTPQDGSECVFVGVHALAWQQQWGQPTVIFNRLSDEDPLIEAFATLEHDQQMLIMEIATSVLKDYIDETYFGDVGIYNTLSDISWDALKQTSEFLTTFMEEKHE